MASRIFRFFHNSIIRKINMVDNIKQNLALHGYIGDSRPAILAYLTMVSALFPKPVSLLIKGNSGAGKSFALSAAQRYIPNDAYEDFSGMSEKALVHLPDDIKLKHKTLIIQEAAGWGSTNGKVFLRQLMTEGEVNYLTVETGENGIKGKRANGAEGPCAVIMTTTNNVLHHEDENRFLSYTVEYDPDHVTQVLVAQARNQLSEPTAEELKPFHDRYSELRDGDKRVIVPYAESLARLMPNSNLRVMRDFPKVLVLIETVALLNSRQREKDATGAVIATLDDFSVVRDLLESSLACGHEQTTPERIRRVVDAVKGREASGVRSDGLSMQQIAGELGETTGNVSRDINAAVALGHLVNDNPGQGRRAQIKSGPIALVNGRVLPSVEELA